MEIRAQVAAEETDEARRKCRKVGEIMGSSLEVLSDQSHGNMLPESYTTSSAAQQSLTPSGHTSDAEPAVILGTDAACGLLAKMPPLTSMQDEPTNAERAATLDASAAWERLGMPPLTLSLEQCRQLLTTASYETLENLWSRETLENLQSEKAPENPLEKFQHANNLVMQAHERKKSYLFSLLQDLLSLLQKEESTYAQGLKGLIDSYRKLTDSYSKLYLNQSPASYTTLSAAQQSLTPSGHTSADAEPAGILGRDAAHGLPAQMPPLTSMQDEPTNAERAATLDASAAWDLWLEMSPLTLSPEQRRQLLAAYETLENLRSRETLENLQSEKAPENPF
ncbi:uncharacterized protein LOC104582496 isoform X3 [Brachypodium distachyon]|uniref:Uncharacterized protein n=1 Tax=Brachypodium distachyon TaxID=15368 RepID=A0A0Q3FX88_BRADI|nr:uncharacterized protein LOC104582496 isoform X3 [Brachypodium distachyon]KQK02837.1 hypothetical protein BRADI_2g04006v3 [Brachypodium distachyon]|eukprot:XP_024314714.1 uncharacterized protein LOC104582496 isoform X3 [Brachypodium distachyon]